MIMISKNKLNSKKHAIKYILCFILYILKLIFFSAVVGNRYLMNVLNFKSQFQIITILHHEDFKAIMLD